MKEVVIGFLGCGNVGGGVWELLHGFAPEIAHRDHVAIRVKKVLVRSLDKARSCSVNPEVLTTNPADILEDPEITIRCKCGGDVDLQWAPKAKEYRN